MITAKELSNTLFNYLTADFDAHGFQLNKSNKLFARKLDGVTQIFKLFFFKRDGKIIIKSEVIIKIEAIEEVYRANTLIAGRPYLTLGNHLMAIVRYMDTHEEKSRGDLLNWLVEFSDDLKKLGEAIPKYLTESILPYFDENSTVARVDELLNKEPREMSVHNWLYPLRANIGLIAARLNNNPNYSELERVYEEELIAADDTYKDDFERIRRKLRVSNKA